jgi:hypothetical protein
METQLAAISAATGAAPVRRPEREAAPDGRP